MKKKKTELTTTKQIETRVKRQIVLEDGKVIEDSGPIVETNTTEDTNKKESESVEVKKKNLKNAKSGTELIIIKIVNLFFFSYYFAFFLSLHTTLAKKCWRRRS